MKKKVILLCMYLSGITLVQIKIDIFKSTAQNSTEQHSTEQKYYNSTTTFPNAQCCCRNAFLRHKVLSTAEYSQNFGDSGPASLDTADMSGLPRGYSSSLMHTSCTLLLSHYPTHITLYRF